MITTQQVIQCLEHMADMRDDWEGEPLRVSIKGTTYFYEDMEDMYPSKILQIEQEMITDNENVVVVRVYPLDVNQYEQDISEHFIDFHLRRDDQDLKGVVDEIERTYQEYCESEGDEE